MLVSKQSDQLRLALVCTRAIGERPSVGREKTLWEIRRALGSHFTVTDFRLHNVFEQRPAFGLLECLQRLVGGLLKGHPIPLQTLVYSSGNELRRLTEAITSADFDVVYVDSIRCQLLVRGLRKAMPGLRIVADFDDLMSRRSEELLRLRIPMSLGFIEQLVPRSLRRLIAGPLSSVILRYEQRSLRLAEDELRLSAQTIVLVSQAEARILNERPLSSDSRRATIVALPPPAPVTTSRINVGAPFRFVFVGTDQLTQNRLAIDCLLDLWREIQPPTGLHIFGRQTRPAVSVANVQWHGFVADIADAYASGSIMLLPAQIAGGIKTKVAEAWAYGIPVLGNSLAFEGLDIPGYPLCRPVHAWTELLLDPANHERLWTHAASIGNTFARTTLSPSMYASRWKDLLLESLQSS